MTQDEIIEMADKADAEADNVLNMKGEYRPNWHQVRDEIFAKLVATKEREACANLCDELQVPPHVSDDDMSMWDVTSMECADAIRARGKA
jgi:hypothetical protein